MSIPIFYELYAHNCVINHSFICYCTFLELVKYMRVKSMKKVIKVICSIWCILIMCKCWFEISACFVETDWFGIRRDLQFLCREDRNNNVSEMDSVEFFNFTMNPFRARKLTAVQHGKSFYIQIHREEILVEIWRL